MTSEKKVLILDSTGKDWTDRHLQGPGIDVFAVYRFMPLPLRVLRRIIFNGNLPGKSLWYSNWKKQLKRYDMIIIFSAILGNEIFSWIRKQGYQGRLIFYYRDCVNAPYLKAFAKPEAIRSVASNVELWTFDPKDAKVYSMTYNPQFYFRQPELKIPIQYDIVFVGSTNGRLMQLLKWKHLFQKMGLKVYFHIKKHRFEKIPEEYKDEVTDQALAYEQILSLNRQSKAILEINQAGQTGLTVRALEATFLKKKLLTTNESIQDTPLYNPDNIFILKNEEENMIRNFMEKPLDGEAFDEEIEYYDAKNWLKRFLLNKNSVNCFLNLWI